MHKRKRQSKRFTAPNTLRASQSMSGTAVPTTNLVVEGLIGHCSVSRRVVDELVGGVDGALQ